MSSSKNHSSFRVRRATRNKGRLLSKWGAVWPGLVVRALLCCLIPFEDFQNVRTFTMFHAHAFKPGDDHGHAGPMAFLTADESREQCPRETERERHSHEVIASLEFHPNIIFSSDPLAQLPATRIAVGLLSPDDPHGISLAPLLRPPREA